MQVRSSGIWVQQPTREAELMIITKMSAGITGGDQTDALQQTEELSRRKSTYLEKASGNESGKEEGGTGDYIMERQSAAGFLKQRAQKRAIKREEEKRYRSRMIELKVLLKEYQAECLKWYEKHRESLPDDYKEPGEAFGIENLLISAVKEALENMKEMNGEDTDEEL